ncbi:MAG: hypothetical protein IPP36_03975 [Nitrosomonadales bacterium]|nr:hypothetical protein [Nitrosomonadales bacterium]
MTVTSTTPTLTIASPADGASINGDSILVSGTLLDPINTGVTVNGVVANVDNGKFYANNVSLQPGANTLTVIYTLADGTAATQKRSVNSTGINPLQVTADAYTGAAPLSVNLAVTGQTVVPLKPSTSARVAMAVSRFDYRKRLNGSVKQLSCARHLYR